MNNIEQVTAKGGYVSILLMNAYAIRQAFLTQMARHNDRTTRPATYSITLDTEGKHPVNLMTIELSTEKTSGWSSRELLGNGTPITVRVGPESKALRGERPSSYRFVDRITEWLIYPDEICRSMRARGFKLIDGFPKSMNGMLQKESPDWKKFVHHQQIPLDAQLHLKAPALQHFLHFHVALLFQKVT
jgi:hypothetical protein